jgi:hypothetical protein
MSDFIGSRVWVPVRPTIPWLVHKVAEVSQFVWSDL